MSQKCFGCNRLSIPFFSWLSGDNLCSDCKKNILSPEVTANFKKNVFEQKKVGQAAVVASRPADWSGVPYILGFLFVALMLWLAFGGLLEDQSSYNTKNTVNIDCAQPDSRNSPYCDGAYESETQEQDFQSDNYNQNIVR